MSEPRPTDRGTWRLVARRDFWVRLRDRGFVISTVITLAVLSILILIRANNAGLDAVVRPRGDSRERSSRGRRQLWGRV